MSSHNQVFAPVLLPGEDDWVLIGSSEPELASSIVKDKPSAINAEALQSQPNHDTVSLQEACTKYISRITTLIAQRQQIEAQATASQQQAQRMKEASERLNKAVEDSRARSMAVHSSQVAAEARLLQQHESLTAARDKALRDREAALQQYNTAATNLRDHRQQREKAERDQKAGLEACETLVQEMEPRVNELTAQFKRLQEQIRSRQ